MASAGGTTPEEASPAGGSPEGSSSDLAARDAEATESATAASAAGGDAAVEAPDAPELAKGGHSGAAGARQGWGLFGLRVDEVTALSVFSRGTSFCPSSIIKNELNIAQRLRHMRWRIEGVDVSISCSAGSGSSVLMI